MSEDRTQDVPVSERIRALTSAAELHTLFIQLAADPKCRWTRTQILHYLPSELHNVASEYFENERIVIPKRSVAQVETPSVRDPDSAISRIRELTVGAPNVEEEPLKRIDPSPLADLIADPPENEHDVIGNILTAILEEAKVVDRDSPKRFRLSSGRCVGPQGDQFIYVFRWSSEPELFLPGELKIGPLTFGARVGRQAEGQRRFELVCPEFLGAEVERAVFKVDPTFLLRAAFECLRAKRDVFSANALATSLFEPPDQDTSDGRLRVDTESLNPLQRRAIAVTGGARRSYVWGPPGTGKTTTLSHLIRALVDDGKRVLVLSPYNVAVDEALLSAFSRGKWQAEELIRVGRISELVRQKGIDLDTALERRAELSGLLAATRSFHAVMHARCGEDNRPAPASVRRCLEELGALQIRNSQQRAEIAAQTRAIRATFRAPETGIIRSARVVGTTVALSYISPVVFERSYDHVVVDEASVLRVPEAVLVALAATGRLSFFGDPKQLPSIVRERSERTEKWLKPNPFDLASIRGPSDAKGSCVMLRAQHRMAPPIREIVSRLFYEGSLEDGYCPASGRVVFFDTSDTPARATTKWIRMSPSKENLVHRGVVSQLIRSIRDEDADCSILVLSPYAAQKRAYDAEANTNRVPRVRFATVHSSQGSESDVVILDLVIAPGRGKSRFMNERLTPEFRNLMNVAMSRARKQLILVGHAWHIEKHYPSGLLASIISHIRANAAWVKVPKSLRMGNSSPHQVAP